jgi:transposase
MRDYTGKTVFLGIDVHKKTYSVAAMCEKVIIKKATLPANPDGLVTFCKKYFQGAAIKSVYEAGFSGFYLHRILLKHGIDNRVVHAAQVEIASGNKVKTDKRDAVKLATQLDGGRLRGIYVPSEEREEKRAVTRMRETMVRHRTTVANQIKALLHQHGLINANSNKKVCPKWIEGLKSLLMPNGIRYALNHLIDMWQEVTIKIKAIDGEMQRQALEDSALEKVYRSVPGIGPVCARVFSNELGDLSQFANERQLFSHTGMTPSEHSSGDHIRKGHISHQGKPIIRKLLILAAWRAIQKDASLRETFDRIARKAGGKKAIVAVARRLIGHIRACFKKQCLYKKQEETAPALAAA